MPKFVKKVIQLLETMMVRHGVMLVGVTSCGKTTCSTVLGKALTSLHAAAIERGDGPADPWHKPVHIDHLNPKSVTMGELFGETNLLTNEWTDGLGSTVIRNANSDTTDDKKFIVFDGPIDAIWIENMNTVLDDK